MTDKNKKARVGLRAKLNIMLVVSIIILAVGLLAITYTFHIKKVKEMYYERAEQVSDAVALSYPDIIPISAYVEMINDEEFKEVQRQAKEANDDKIIEDWMRRREPVYTYVEYTDKADTKYTFYDEYKAFSDYLKVQKETFDLKSVYFQYVKDGVSYNLVDPDESLTYIGSTDDPVEEFASYNDSESIPATIYDYKGDWLCTASELMRDKLDDGTEVVGHLCVDFDMNNVAEDQRWFLFNSTMFIVALTLLVMLISMLLARKFVTRPLKQLSKGAKEFAVEEGEAFSMDDVIELPIHSNDEIGDLYAEIKSMQRRIVEGTDKLTRITAERERVSTELNMATRIQASMLPSRFPAFPDIEEFDLYASMDPAKEVGGDFYDFFMIDDNHLVILIADVSDKGVPAALFMMSTKILINYRAKKGGSPAEIISDVNTQIAKDNKEKMFVTVWMGILDICTGDLECTNAGHEYPIIRTKDEGFRVCKDVRGAMVGVRSGISYKDYIIKLEQGDAIFVYTDGVPEAINASEEMYGMERLEEALNGLKDKSPEDILRGVREDVDKFVGDTKQFDDLTMLCVEYKGKRNG